MRVVDLDFKSEVANFILEFEFGETVFEKRINIEMFLKMLKVI